MKETIEEKIDRLTIPEPNTGCLLWTGYAPYGYGRIRAFRKQWDAHRLVYFMKHGPIAPGLHVRHKCDTPACCNIEHLELGTFRQNIQDRVDRGRCSGGNRGITHCKRGHEFTPENTWVGKQEWRWCHTCRRYRQAKLRNKTTPSTLGI